MNPLVKYTLGRLGLFVACALVLIAAPAPVNIFVKLMVALVASIALQFVLLRTWRLQMIAYLDQTMARRREERDKLRAALAGDDEDQKDA